MQSDRVFHIRDYQVTCKGMEKSIWSYAASRMSFLTNGQKKQNDPLVGHYLNILSAYWIGGMYETFRPLRDRKLGDSNELFKSIVDDLELICVPLEKHEIAKDKKLKKPLRTIRHPRRNDERDF